MCCKTTLYITCVIVLLLTTLTIIFSVLPPNCTKFAGVNLYCNLTGDYPIIDDARIYSVWKTFPNGSQTLCSEGVCILNLDIITNVTNTTEHIVTCDLVNATDCRAIEFFKKYCTVDCVDLYGKVADRFMYLTCFAFSVLLVVAIIVYSNHQTEVDIENERLLRSF